MSAAVTSYCVKKIKFVSENIFGVQIQLNCVKIEIIVYYNCLNTIRACAKERLSEESPREARRRGAASRRSHVPQIMPHCHKRTEHRSADDRIVGTRDENETNEFAKGLKKSGRRHDAPSRTSTTIKLMRNENVDKE